MSPSSLDHVPEPGARWAFDEGVTACFDDMLRRSIPQYEVMRAAVADLAVYYAQPGTDVVDLGCSRGEAMAPLVRRLAGEDMRFLGVEVSPPMREAARERFAREGNVELLATDLREGYPACRASVTLCVLTLQFTPIEHRQRILRDAYARTVPGGALVLVEKVLGASAGIDAAEVALYYDLKRANGYPQASIDQKRRSLEGVLVPVTARWNEELLRGAGFAEVDGFWRWMNFAGWVAVKSSSSAA